MSSDVDRFDWLAAMLDEMLALGKRRGEECLIYPHPPATRSDIENAENVLGLKFSESHKAFLLKYDGLTIWFGRSYAADDPRFDISYQLPIYSVDDIVLFTQDLRGYIDLEDDAVDLLSAALGCVDFTGGYGPSFRILYSQQPEKDCSDSYITVADLYAQDWMYKLRDLPPEQCVAHAFDEFLRHSFEHMIKHELGFDYWTSPEYRTDDWLDTIS